MTALLLPCGAAQASNWVSLGKPDSGIFEDFIDVSSIRIEGNVRRAWFKKVYKAHTEKAPDDGRYEESSVEKNAFNCSQEMYRIEALTVYFEDGTLYRTPAESYPIPWVPVTPDTVEDKQMKFICRWKP